MSALGRPQDMFSDSGIQLQPVFAQWVQNALGVSKPSGDVLALGGKIAMMPISLGTSDFLV